MPCQVHIRTLGTPQLQGPYLNIDEKVQRGRGGSLQNPKTNLLSDPTRLVACT